MLRSKGSPVEQGFTLVELLVVIGVIGILIAIATPLIPSLLRGNQLNSSVNTLSGILEEARETAMSGNTFVWVAFTAPIVSAPTLGTYVATIQSADGTETNVNTSTTTTPTWATTLTIPSTAAPNLLLHAKIQNLPGLWIDTTTPLPFTKVPSALITKAPAASLSTPLATSITWNVTTLANSAAGSTARFTYAVEFTPNGEAHVPTWKNNVQVAMYPSIGSNSDSVIFNISRLTGKTTVFR